MAKVLHRIIEEKPFLLEGYGSDMRYVGPLGLLLKFLTTV